MHRVILTRSLSLTVYKSSSIIFFQPGWKLTKMPSRRTVAGEAMTIKYTQGIARDGKLPSPQPLEIREHVLASLAPGNTFCVFVLFLPSCCGENGTHEERVIKNHDLFRPYLFNFYFKFIFHFQIHFFLFFSLKFFFFFQIKIHRLQGNIQQCTFDSNTSGGLLSV